MPGQFVQSYGVRLHIAGSGDGVHESVVELMLLSLWVSVFAGDPGGVVVWSIPVVLAWRVMSAAVVLHSSQMFFVCRNKFVSYNSLSLVNSVACLH